MSVAIGALLVVHGLIHGLGAAKGFGWAQLPQLTQPISPVFGAVWMAAGLCFLVSAVTLFAWPRGWWAVGFAAVVISMVAIVPSWSDAKAGAAANGIVLVAIAQAWWSQH